LAKSNGVTLEQAGKIVEAALATARRMKYEPMSVAVLDRGGHLVAFKREDGSGIMRYEIAVGKAWGALGMGRPSRVLNQMAIDRPFFIGALVGASGGRLVPVPGGVLIHDADGDLLGACGVSGDQSDPDERCAIEGVRAAGLSSLPAKMADE
jgi:uncharacterized protein GlcG (DUF336 family)